MFKIEEASREGAKIVLGLAGVSGGGKTFTALQLAFGLAKMNGDKVGFLDTENRRGRLYSDSLPGRAKFRIADMIAPFSPARYIEGIHAFEAAGCEVLVIDSMSHEWEGIGGCEEIATDGNPKTPRWNVAKLEHKKCLNHLLQSSMHIICCFRAREKVKMKPGANGRVEVEQLGIQPITEKSMMFDMTASLLMENEGKSQQVLKCPHELRPFFGRGTGYLTAEDGLAIREWVDGATPVNKELERHKAELKAACEWGMKALEETWKGLPKEAQRALKDDLPTYKASAEAYDRQSEIATPTAETP